MKKVEIILKKQNKETNEIYEEIIELDKNIEELSLSDMNLIEIPKGLEQFKNLKYLDLSFNKISKIENFDNLINLEYLYLKNNQISKIENLDKNINLESLFLRNNKITRIENIHHLKKLEYLFLFNLNQRENIKESLKISFDNHLLEQKELQIQNELQQELLKQENKRKKEKEYFDKNFKEIHQQFIQSNIKNDNDLLI